MKYLIALMALVVLSALVCSCSESTDPMPDPEPEDRDYVLLVVDPDAGSNGEVIVVDPVTGEQEVLVSGGYHWYGDLVEGRDGLIYCTDPVNGEIDVFDPSNGEFSVSISGGHIRPFGLCGIAVDDAGALLVPVHRVQNTAVQLLRVIPGNVDQEVLSAGGQFYDLYDVKVSGAGAVYVSGSSIQNRRPTATIFQIDPETGAQTVKHLSASGYEYRQFDFDRSGNIWAVEDQVRVVKIDATTGASTPMTVDLDSVFYTGIFVGAADEVFVSRFSTHTLDRGIQRFDRDAGTWVWLGQRDNFMGPEGIIAVDRSRVGGRM